MAEKHDREKLIDVALDLCTTQGYEATTIDQIAAAKRMKADGHTGKDIAKYLGVSRATLYRYLIDHSAA